MDWVLVIATVLSWVGAFFIYMRQMELTEMYRDALHKENRDKISWMMEARGLREELSRLTPHRGAKGRFVAKKGLPLYAEGQKVSK